MIAAQPASLTAESLTKIQYSNDYKTGAVITSITSLNVCLKNRMSTQPSLRSLRIGVGTGSREGVTVLALCNLEGGCRKCDVAGQLLGLDSYDW